MNRWMIVFLVSVCGTQDAMAASSAPEPTANSSGKKTEAVRVFNEGITHRNKGWEYEQKAQGVEEAGDRSAYERVARTEYGKALADFRKATELNPNFHQAFGSLGYVLRKTGDYEGALKAYARSLDLNADYALAIEYRGEAFLELDRIEDARRAYDRLKELKSKYAPTLLERISEWAEDRRRRGRVDQEVLTATDAWLDAHRRDLAEAPRKETLW